MSIIEEAETFKWKETGEKIAQTLKEINYPDKDLAFYEVLRFFDITSVEQLKNPETLKKVETIFEYFKDSNNILEALRLLNSKLGNPFDLTEKLNKIYSFVYSENLEKGFQEEKERKDTQMMKELAKKAQEKKDIELRKEKQTRMEKIKKAIKERDIKLAEIEAKTLKRKQEKEIAEKIEIIKRASKPKQPEPPKIIF